MRVSGMMGKGCAAAAVAVVVGGVARGAVNYGVDNPVSLGVAGYTQNFDSLPAGTGAGTAQTGGWYPTVGSDSNPRLAGWDVWTQATLTSGTNGPTNHDRLYTAGSSVGNTGSFYSLGTSSTAGSNRALGAQSASTTSAMYMGVTFVNTTGSAIDSLNVSYLGEIWRSGGSDTAAGNGLAFLYKINPTTSNAIGTDGSFVPVAALKLNSFPEPSGASYDGTQAAYQTTISGVVDLSAHPLAPGDKISLRWQAVGQSAAANADLLAVDNFSVVPHVVVPEPASLGLVAGAVVIPMMRRRRV